MALNDTTELLALIRRRGSIPVNFADWDDSAIFEQCQREMHEWHLPLLCAARGEYLVKVDDIALVAGQRSYRLHRRAAAVREVGFLQSDGQLLPVPVLESAKFTELQSNVNTVGRTACVVFREHFLDVYPLPGSSSDKLRVKFHVRQSRPTALNNFAAVSSISNPSAGVTRFTFSAPGGSLFPSGNNPMDFIKATSPFDILAMRVTPVANTGTTRDFTTADLPVPLPEVGDYLGPPDYSPFLNQPVELFQAAALRTAASVIAPRDPKMALDLVAEADAKEKQLLKGILAPRSKGNAKTIATRRWG